MSYSTSMYVYNWESIEDINKILNEIVNIFKYCVPYRLESDYWCHSNDDFEFFDDFMIKQIELSIEEKRQELFIFCNHDGVNDDEVDRLFLIFGKIFSRLCPDILICVNDSNSNIYFINYDNGIISTNINDNSTKEIDYLFNKYKKIKYKLKINEIDNEINKFENKSD